MSLIKKASGKGGSIAASQSKKLFPDLNKNKKDQKMEKEMLN